MDIYSTENYVLGINNGDKFFSGKWKRDNEFLELFWKVEIFINIAKL